MNSSNDIKIIKEELKLISYHSYIATFFAKYQYRNKLLLIIYIDLELAKIVNSNVDKMLILTKLNWWKLSCSDSIDGKYFGVPSLRLLNKYFDKDNLIKEELSQLIIYLINYCNAESLNSKAKIYSKYLLTRNKIIFNLLNLKPCNINIKKSLNFLIVFKSLSEHNSNELAKKFYDKAKQLCKRPNRRYLIFFILNSNNYFSQGKLYRKIFLSFTRDW